MTIWNTLNSIIAKNYTRSYPLEKYLIPLCSIIFLLVWKTKTYSRLKDVTISPSLKNAIRKKKPQHKKVKWVPGIFNPGNSCFMNALLQALAPFTSFQEYIKKATLSQDSPNLAFILLAVLKDLNTPLSSKKIIYPTELLKAIKTLRTIDPRYQQDAHELFQLMLEQLNIANSHSDNFWKLHSETFNQINISPNNYCQKKQIGQIFYTSSNLPWSISPLNLSPFDGLLAHKLACMKCGYCGPIHHTLFNNLSIQLPSKSFTTLYECLESFVFIDRIRDAYCPKCSVEAAIQVLERKKEKTIDSVENKHLQSKIIKLRKILKENVANALELKSMKLLKKQSPEMRKQIMIARFPSVLCIHLNRTQFLLNGTVGKNNILVEFPESLDITPFSTNGHLLTDPKQPLSTPFHFDKSVCVNLSSKTCPLYRLTSVMVHLGSNNKGHFVCYRQGVDKNSWFYTSDQHIEKSTLQEALKANPYMLFYEKI